MQKAGGVAREERAPPIFDDVPVAEGVLELEALISLVVASGFHHIW